MTATLNHPAKRSVTRTLDIPLNRVEGDLSIRVELDSGRVSEAWSSGTMYRGIENILLGRGPLDGLVITPRICGICSTAHLTAASKALDSISGIQPPPDAIRVRNLALMAELLQSDVRQTFLTFAADFTNGAYQRHPLHEEALRRYAPMKGETAIDVIRQTRKIVEIVAILGGQWPHSSYMVPGGVAGVPSLADLLQCQHLLAGYRAWYERRILGCSIDRWGEVRSGADLDNWLHECAAHRDSDLGFFIRFARQNGLDRIGGGHGNFISFGLLDLPPGTEVRSRNGSTTHLMGGGFARGAHITPFDPANVTEHVAHSWYVDYPAGRHPFEGETRPYATGEESQKYSWAKAPRYADLPAETGPLAEMVVSRNPLFADLLTSGPSVLTRQLARLVRPAELMPAMQQWLSEICPDGTFYDPASAITEGEGFGTVDAARGALGHWVRIEGGSIQRYQIITPTAWNGSPRDSGHVRGPWEEALIGTPVADPENPVEVGHVVRSFDPCLVCTVHALRGRCSLACRDL
ncbi:MAG TPA: nickel-dependent hydrogenase large subunit [Phycisphaerae bacterium]|nr:nickel-dependent hydrogenase large subunit [Phycisphaerae bacterium]HRY71445.1 nickel-dependent hydrogenase large subunit [Phycisphaerae bacterium]HSA27712.1 nickel-dependent hydrogenase large subunit [Phycisphaerae bacterium]